MPEVRDNQEKNPDVFKIWSDAQQTWMATFRHLTEAAGRILSGKGDIEETGGPMDVWIRSYREALDGLVRFPVSGPLRNILEMFLSAANAFLKMHRSWLQILKDSQDSGMGRVTTDALKGWSEAVKTMLDSMARIPLPEPLRTSLGPAGEFQQFMLRSFADNLRGSMASYQQFFIPWVEALEGLSTGAAGVMEGSAGASAIQRFHDTWNSAYNDTIGKFFAAPPVGPSRVTMEKALRAMDAYLKFYGANIDFAFRVYEPGMQAFEKISQKAAEIFQREVTPDAFRDLYNLSLQIYEETFHQLFKSESFVRGLHLVLDATLEFRRRNDEFVEVLLRETPIVTQSQMNEVYAELHRLKRTVRDLQAELKSARKTGSKSPASPAAS